MQRSYPSLLHGSGRHWLLISAQNINLSPTESHYLFLLQHYLLGNAISRTKNLIRDLLGESQLVPEVDAYCFATYSIQCHIQRICFTLYAGAKVLRDPRLHMLVGDTYTMGAQAP